MQTIYIIHYFYPGTDPWKNIMNLTEKEAFRIAAELAAVHPKTTSFGRFADVENYYPNRKKADEYVREEFIRLGGKPELLHPYSFALSECEYLRKWFSEGEKLVLNGKNVTAEKEFTSAKANLKNGMAEGVWDLEFKLTEDQYGDMRGKDIVIC